LSKKTVVVTRSNCYPLLRRVNFDEVNKRVLVAQSLEEMEESLSELDEWEERDFKLVKIKGIYGSYEVKRRLFTDEELIF
jgi:hypothetical protein